jgi:hypothetical protein
MPTASAICGMKTWKLKAKIFKTYEESVTSYRPLWVGNFIAKGDADGRNVQTGLADRIG